MNLETYRQDFEEDCWPIITNKFFSPADLFLCYGMIRTLKPKKIMEIGAGFTSYCMNRAMVRYQTPNIVSLDPSDSRKSLVPHTFVKTKWQEFAYKKKLAAFEKNDVLFIDGNHTEEEFDQYSEKLFPLLKKGVIVHFHDICDNPFDRYYDPDNTECPAVLKFLKESPDYFDVLVNGNKENQWSYSLWLRRKE